MRNYNNEELKVMILAGGFGTRISEYTDRIPKPMIEIGGMPILWHILMHYSRYSFNNFVIACGYKSEVIKKFFLEYRTLISNLSLNFKTCDIHFEDKNLPEWEIQLVDTGLSTQTGGRIKRLLPYVDRQTFMLTWGDGVSDVNLDNLLAFHSSHGKLATMTVVRPPARFGHIDLEGDKIVSFTEKPQAKEGWINGAFFVLEPQIFDYIDSDLTHWEKEPLERLAKDGQLMAYKHTGFWHCMDTLRDKRNLDRLWENGKAPWKTWE